MNPVMMWALSMMKAKQFVNDYLLMMCIVMVNCSL